MGKWVYYAAVVELREIAARVGFAQVIHGADRSLNKLIQRDLETRSGEIAEYLIRQKTERFFNSLVIGLYEGNPDWYYATLRTHERIDVKAIPEYGLDTLGLLVFDGTERLFALDGQHRVAGIIEAVASHPSLAHEFITVLFVPHENTPAGLQRTRRLFTTLNRYAKPVAKARLIALEEDDPAAIVTRRLIAEQPLFLNRTATKQPKSLPRSDKTSVTTIGALYEAIDVYLRYDRSMSAAEWKRYKRIRPPEVDIEIMVAHSKRLWSRLTRAIPVFRRIVKGPADMPGKFRRTEDGGDLWARPIGTMILADLLIALRRAGRTEQEAVRKLARIPSKLNQLPWRGLLWDLANRRMITQGENRRVATALAFSLCGGELDALGYSKKELEEEWSGLVGEDRRLSDLS